MLRSRNVIQDPDCRLPLAFDLSRELAKNANGEALGSATWLVPDGMTEFASPAIVGNLAVCHPTGGTPGTTYTWTCRWRSAVSGRGDDISFYITVRER